MNIHYTGRNLEVPPQVAKIVQSRLSKLKKILGPRPAMETHVILSLVRHVYRVEITVNLRDHAVVGVAETPELNASLKDALDRLEKQAMKHKARLRVKKRHARPQVARSIRTLALRAEVA
jgi:putative sigma-54 modulation protein